MNLSSVRELKSDLLSSLIERPARGLPGGPAGGAPPGARFNLATSFGVFGETPFGGAPFGGAPFGTPAPRASARAAAAKQMAIGVTRRKAGDFMLAVRAQEKSARVQEIMRDISEQARGEVDERFIGRVTPQAVLWRNKRPRPLRLGCSVGHVRVTAGTLGCFVRIKGDPRVMMLSNNHVLANENDAQVGDAIVQPGPDDGDGDVANIVARLVEWVEIDVAGRNVIDCAVAALEPGIAHAGNRLTTKGKAVPPQPADPEIDEKVYKLGRTTEKTAGRITTIELDKLFVDYDIGPARFDDQIEIEGIGNKTFSDGGDSGSLIVDSKNRPVALLFAGSDEGGTNGKGLTFANSIKTVLATLDLEML